MSQMGCFVQRTGAASVTLLVAASLAVSGCGSSKSSSSVASCFAKHAAPGTASSAPSGSPNPAVAAAWTLRGGNPRPAVRNAGDEPDGVFRSANRSCQCDPAGRREPGGQRLREQQEQLKCGELLR